MEIITLSNGKKVGNFSSPHSFIFTDGSVLPAVSNEEAEKLSVSFKETLINSKGDLRLSFELTHYILIEMDKWMHSYNDEKVDVVFCPLPMITALQSRMYPITASPFRAIRIEDRIKKLVSIDKQCL